MHPLFRIFAPPIAIALLSLIGLVSALIGDGVLDWLSWLGLTAPLAIIAWALLSRRDGRR